MQGVQSPLAGQVVFRSVLFGAFGAAKRWLSTNPDGSTRPLTTADFYKVCLICTLYMHTCAVAAYHKTRQSVFVHT